MVVTIRCGCPAGNRSGEAAAEVLTSGAPCFTGNMAPILDETLLLLLSVFAVPFSLKPMPKPPALGFRSGLVFILSDPRRTSASLIRPTGEGDRFLDESEGACREAVRCDCIDSVEASFAELTSNDGVE